MKHSDLRKGVFSGFAWQGTTKLVVQLTSWAATLFVARIIAPADYGLIAAAAVFIEMLGLITDMGLAHGLIQKPSISRQEEDGVFFISLALGVAGYLLMFLTAPLIASFYEMPLLSSLIRVLSISIIFSSLKTVPMAIAMRRMDFRYRSLVEMSAYLSMTLAVVLLALAGFGVWSLVFGTVLSAAVMAVGYLPLLGRVPRLHFSFPEVSGVVRFGVKYMNTELLYSVWNWAPAVIIGKVLGERILGYYSMAFQLSTMPLDKIAHVFNQVMFPALARLQEDQGKSRKLFLDLHGYLLLVCYPIVFGMMAVADDGIRLLLTDKWAPIVPYFQLLCLVSALRLTATPMPVALFARGKPEIVMRYNFFSLITLPPAFFFGANLAGLEGVVLAWMVIYPFLFFYIGHQCLKEFAISWRALALSGMPAAVASIFMVFAVVMTRESMREATIAFRFGFSLVVGAMVYMGVLLMLLREKILNMKRRFFVFKQGEIPNQ